MPSVFARRTVSVLVVAHFFAIFAVVTSSSSPNFPAPQLSVQASARLQPYLQAVFLNNAYRFFAPNPGTPTVFWFRVQYDDRSVRWVELPGRSNPLWRAPYQRRLNLAVQLGQYLGFVQTPDGNKEIGALGNTLLQSSVRHVAYAYPRQAADGTPVSVRNVGVYSVLHAVVLPAQVRAGWKPIDLRTYRASFLGAYTPQGERVDEFRPKVVDQSIARVAAGIIEVDVLPRWRTSAAADRHDILTGVELPEPVRGLLDKYPELLAATSADDLIRRIETLVPEDARRP